jgi:phosphoserine phosphatase RsbX
MDQGMLSLEWAAAGRPIAGETESGDQCLVQPFDGGVLLGLVDGLGHGRLAAQAAHAAVALIRGLAGQPLDRIVTACHTEIGATRGVVLGLAAFFSAESKLCFAGIGNVDGVLLAPQGAGFERLLLVSRGGVVGKHIPKPRVATLPLAAGAVLVLVSDGIRQSFATELEPQASVHDLADGICAKFARPTDDALVLVARWRGST